MQSVGFRESPTRCTICHVSIDGIAHVFTNWQRARLDVAYILFNFKHWLSKMAFASSASFKLR
jgi:hypothetical protein